MSTSGTPFPGRVDAPTKCRPSTSGESSCGMPVRTGGRNDIVFANILSGHLINLAPSIASVTASGGRVLLAGLLRRQEQQVERTKNAATELEQLKELLGAGRILDLDKDGDGRISKREYERFQRLNKSASERVPKAGASQQQQPVEVS